VDFAEWEPVYEAILEDFGYPRAADERARDRLAELLAPREFDVGRIDSGPDDTIAVAGAGPSLEAEAALAADADRVFAASNAAERLLAVDVTVDLEVTDLDKTPRSAVELTREGTPVAVHAHGDNRPTIESVVPECDREQVLGTTQAAPADPVRNVGGFTDGDRAAFLADHLGAGRLTFPGWDFEDPDLDPEKRHKLRWAERLLHWLERRRDDRFDVLDGRRSGIDLSALEL